VRKVSRRAGDLTLSSAGLVDSPACGGVVGPWNGLVLEFGRLCDDVDATINPVRQDHSSPTIRPIIAQDAAPPYPACRSNAPRPRSSTGQ
jgi:hypothetical protein